MGVGRSTHLEGVHGAMNMFDFLKKVILLLFDIFIPLLLMRKEISI